MSDAKEKQLIDYYYNKINKRIFNEKDIYMFLMLLRNYTTSKSALREFADFIAHRDKDRGKIKDYINETKKQLFQKQGKRTIDIHNIFTYEQLQEEFNEVLQKLSKINFNSEIIQDILLCIIVLLQDVKLFDKKKKCIGKLVIGINKEEISLLGNISVPNATNNMKIVFPVLTVNNKYTHQFDDLTDNMATLKVVVEIENIMFDMKLKYLTDYKII